MISVKSLLNRWFPVRRRTPSQEGDYGPHGSRCECRGEDSFSVKENSSTGADGTSGEAAASSVAGASSSTAVVVVLVIVAVARAAVWYPHTKQGRG